MSRLAYVLLFLALVQYGQHDVPMGSTLGFYLAVNEARMKPLSVARKTSRKLLQEPDCEGGEACLSSEECLGDCICEELDRPGHLECVLDT